MFQKSVLLFSVLFITSSCSLKLDAPIAPNLQKVTADGNNLDKASTENPLLRTAAKKLLERSVTEKNNGTKKFIFNISVNDKLKPYLNSNLCLQISRFGDDTLVVDFADISCPADGVLLPADHIKYTANFYEVKKDSEYVINSANSGKTIGKISADWSFPTAQITEFCSGSVASNCKVTLSYNSFVDILDL